MCDRFYSCQKGDMAAEYCIFVRRYNNPGRQPCVCVLRHVRLAAKILANGIEKQYNKVHKYEGKICFITFKFVHNDERM